jgi:plasmid stabilization system protein ParE
MADTHRVLITADALADLQAIAAHIRRDSPQNAAAVAERIIDAIDSLESMPTRFRRAGTSRKLLDRFTPHAMMSMCPI